MHFLLTGFKTDLGFRVFEFEGIAEDRSRTGFSVRADLGLIRDYGIRVQELPLLCRDLLEQSDEVARGSSMTFTGEHMRVHAAVCAAARTAAAAKRPRHKAPLTGTPNADPDAASLPEECL